MSSLFTGFTVFARFFAISRAPKAMFLFCFYLTFSSLEILMKKYFLERKWVFSPNFLNMTQLSFDKIDFRNSFAACLFVPPHISPFETPYCIFAVKRVFSCMAEISAFVPKHVLLVQTISLFLSSVFIFYLGGISYLLCAIVYLRCMFLS
jgi:hypothetical protein